MGDSENFGDPRWSSSDFLPVPESKRLLSARQAVAFWASLGLHPAVTYGASVRRGLSVDGLAAVALGASLTALLGFFLLRLPYRYGLGWVVTARATFGTRGAQLIAVVRFVAAVVWCASWVYYLASWGARFVLGTTERLAPELDFTLAEHSAFATGVFSFVFIVAARRVFMSGIFRFARGAFARIKVAALAGVALVVLALAQGGALPELSPSLGGLNWLREALLVAFATLVPLVAFPEWSRLRARPGVDPQSGRSLAPRSYALVPFACVPAALFFAFLSSAMVSISLPVVGVAQPSLIATGASSAGILGGAAALVLELMLFLAVVPLAGYGGAHWSLLAWRRIGFRARYSFAFLAILAVSSLPLYAPRSFTLRVDLVLAVSGIALAPIVALMAIDDGILRRGRVALEELYYAPSHYGPILGYSFVALGATALAIFAGFSPVFPSLPVAMRVTVSLGAYQFDLAQSLLATVAAAAGFALLAPLERRLALVPRRGSVEGDERGAEVAALAESEDGAMRGAEEAREATGGPEGDSGGPLPFRGAPPLPIGHRDPTEADDEVARWSTPAEDGSADWPEAEDDSEMGSKRWFDGDWSEASNPSETEVNPRFIKPGGGDD